jgi:hypothetical protein
MQDERQAALEARVAAVMGEDNVDGAMKVCERYPRLDSHPLSAFERDVRDWGLIYGIAFGLARVDGDEPGEIIAERAYKVARGRFAQWAGEIEDPEVVRERAVGGVVREFTAAQELAYRAARTGGSYRKIEMTEALCQALSELESVEIEGTSIKRNDDAVLAKASNAGGDA